MKQRYFSLAFLTMALMVLAAPAFAQSTGNAGDVGSEFFNSLQDMITGNVGFFLGLAITVLGIWTWVIKQQTGAGVIMIIGGVLITLSPSLFNSAQNFLNDTLETVNGGGNTLKPGNIN
jgi:type IV secretory pathway VirB2 component (pilin)